MARDRHTNRHTDGRDQLHFALATPDAKCNNPKGMSKRPLVKEERKGDGRERAREMGREDREGRVAREG